MSQIKLNDQSIRQISLFEKITHARVKDCIEGPDIIFFIVEPGQLTKAIGKSGSNVKRLRHLLNKNVDIIEFSLDIKKFIRNIFHEFKLNDISIEEKNNQKNKVALVSVDPRTKGKVIGKGSRNLKFAREILNRYHPLDIMII
jgi:N utilization substance protein A